MEFDQLHHHWHEHDRTLDDLLRLRRGPIQGPLSRAWRQARSSSRWAAVAGMTEVVIGLIALLWLGDYLAENISQLRFAVPAIALHLYIIVSLVFGGRQLFWIHHLDYQLPLLEIQRRLEGLRIERLRALKQILLLAPLLWLFLLIVGLEATMGIDFYQTFPRSWVISNLILGLAWIPAASWAARRWSRTFKGSALVQRLLRGLAGQDLETARDSLAELKKYDVDETG